MNGTARRLTQHIYPLILWIVLGMAAVQEVARGHDVHRLLMIASPRFMP